MSMTKLRNDASGDAREHFLRNVRKMANNAILLQRFPDGRIDPVFVSEEFAAMMECSVPEAKELMTGLGMFKTTDPEDRPLVRSMLKHRVAYDGSSVLTIQKITAKKHRVFVNVHYAFIDDFEEQYIYCTYTDVTVLKAHELRLRSIYSNLGSSFYQENEKTLANFRANLSRDSFEEINGRDLYETDSQAFTYTELMRQRLSYMPVRAEREQFLRLFNKDKLSEDYLMGKAYASQVFFSIRQGGRSCFVKFTASVTRHPMRGDIVAFITEQECNSEKVKGTLMDKILAQQFDMVAYLVDGQYGVTIGDAARARRGGIFPIENSGDYQEYLETQVLPALSGDEEERREAACALSLEVVGEQIRQREPYVVNVAVALDGELFYKQFDFYSIDPEAKFYILLKSDTTEIQKRHAAMNEQLRMALDAANQANVAKTAFLSSMSHEIRTPMNAIIGLDSIALKDPGLSARTRDHLEKIGASARHLLGLINDVLDMSRIESGRMNIKSEEFSFADMLEQINTMIHSQCQDKGLSYECQILGPVDDYYIGDDMKLKQVIINILGNAVKFTPSPGKVSFLVERAAAFDGQSTLRFTMRDTGIGMDKAYLPRIFDAFSQEDSSKANKYGSTGLGMAITKSIVELMNGNISVESEKGVGTVFTVRVTLRNSSRQREAAGELLPQEGEGTAEGDLALLKGCRVLLAEDVFVNAEIMKELLSMMEMETEHAENGQIAVEMFARSGAGYYDAVLMDVRMPVMDGLAAAAAIRGLPRPDAGSIPIIAMTANAFDEDVQRSLQAGMDAHLSKPVEPDRLYKTLGEMIGREGRA